MLRCYRCGRKAVAAAFGVDAATVVLAVEPVLTSKLNGTFVALFFLKIGRQVLNAVFLGEGFANFVKLLCVFQRTDT